ncbi:hypothetical protein Pelo_3122 [Pelomyxa schiedti]|nr:hypothetical protein Pelo_3122 [Pelomyxa schiedti]
MDALSGGAQSAASAVKLAQLVISAAKQWLDANKKIPAELRKLEAIAKATERVITPIEADPRYLATFEQIRGILDEAAQLVLAYSPNPTADAPTPGRKFIDPSKYHINAIGIAGNLEAACEGLIDQLTFLVTSTDASRGLRANTCNIITDNAAKQFWINPCFGSATLSVPYNVFVSQLEVHCKEKLTPVHKASLGKGKILREQRPVTVFEFQQITGQYTFQGFLDLLPLFNPFIHQPPDSSCFYLCNGTSVLQPFDGDESPSTVLITAGNSGSALNLWRWKDGRLVNAMTRLAVDQDMVPDHMNFRKALARPLDISSLTQCWTLCPDGTLRHDPSSQDCLQVIEYGSSQVSVLGEVSNPPTANQIWQIELFLIREDSPLVKAIPRPLPALLSEIALSSCASDSSQLALPLSTLSGTATTTGDPTSKKPKFGLHLHHKNH